VDSRQNIKLIRQLLEIIRDPEKASIAKAMFQFGGDDVPIVSPAEAKPKERKSWPVLFKKKLADIWNSTPVWGAIGVLIGAIIGQLSRKLLFVGAWIVLWIEIIRGGFFDRFISKVVGNAVLGLLLAALILEVWRISPQPKEPPTLDQEITALDSLSHSFSFLLPKHKVSQASAVFVIAARASYSVPSTFQPSALLSVDPEFFQFHQCNQHLSSSWVPVANTS